MTFQNTTISTFPTQCTSYIRTALRCESYTYWHERLSIRKKNKSRVTETAPIDRSGTDTRHAPCALAANTQLVPYSSRTQPTPGRTKVRSVDPVRGGRGEREWEWEREREREKETRCLVCPAHPGYTHPSIYSWIHSARRVNSAEFGLILPHPLSPLIFIILPLSLYLFPLRFILIYRHYYNSCSLIFLTTKCPARNRAASRTRYA